MAESGLDALRDVWSANDVPRARQPDQKRRFARGSPQFFLREFFPGLTHSPVAAFVDANYDICHILDHAIMKYVAVQMLFGDRAKLFGLVFSLAFASFLLMNQTSIFAGIMARTGSQILDVVDAPVWVMDPKTPYADEIAPMTDNQLFRVRGVDAVSWAVPLYKGSARAKAADGTFRQCVLMGVDDATLTGAVRKIVLGSMEALRQPDTIVLDKAGYGFFFPGQPLQLGRTLEMNDHRVIIGAISDAGAPFTTFPVIYAR